LNEKNTTPNKSKKYHLNNYTNSKTLDLKNINKKNNDENKLFVISPSNNILSRNNSNTNILAKDKNNNHLNKDSLNPINNYNSSINNNKDKDKDKEKDKDKDDKNRNKKIIVQQNIPANNNNNNNNNNIIDSRKFSILDIQSSEKPNDIKLFIGILFI